jgi:hypothetical protein
MKVPKEHGAWAMLYVSLGVGTAVAGRLSWTTLSLALSATFLFIGRESFGAWWRGFRRRRGSGAAGRVFMAYLGLSVLSGAPLVLISGLFWVLPFGLLMLALAGINAEQSAWGKHRTARGEIMVIVGLTGSAAAAHYVASGRLEATAFWLWGLTALYFTSSVFFVKALVKAAHSRDKYRVKRSMQHCVSYHLFLVGVLAIVLLVRPAPPLVVLAFIPALARTAWRLARPVKKVNLKRIGVLEIVYSLFYAVFLVITFRGSAMQ